MARRAHPIRHVVAAAAVLVLALAGCTTGTDDEPTPSVTPSSSASGPAPSATTPRPSPSTTTPGGRLVVPAFYVVDTRTGLRLARELRAVAGIDRVRSAVETMIAGPLDPDYTTTWDPGTEVLAAGWVDGVLVVDLSADARTANVGSEGAALMIQQLVYTASAAAGSAEAPVQLLIEGEPAGELWGVVTWDAPVVRADPISVRLLVQIDTPTEGDSTSSPVRVAGEAAVFEAVVSWAVLDVAGREVSTGITMTTEGQTFAPFVFAVELVPGEYTVVITEDDPSDGAAGVPMSDSRAVTVTAP